MQIDDLVDNDLCTNEKLQQNGSESTEKTAAGQERKLCMHFLLCLRGIEFPGTDMAAYQ